MHNKCCTFIQLSISLAHVAADPDQLIPLEDLLTMNRIQKWLEQIAGVSRAERARWALAQEIFGSQRMDISALQKPACWRRKEGTCSPRR